MQVFTTGHPELTIEVVDRLEVGQGMVLFEVVVPTTGPRGWSEEIRSLPSVKTVELIDASETQEVYRVVSAGRTFLPLLKRLKLIRHFPFPIQDGVAHWTIVGPEERVRALLERLRASAVRYELVSVRKGPLSRLPSSLTPRQREILTRAVGEGYFDVPRRISLTQLAPRIGVAVSTLSVMLALIEKKIVLAAFTQEGGGLDREQREPGPPIPRPAA